MTDAMCACGYLVDTPDCLAAHEPKPMLQRLSALHHLEFIARSYTHDAAELAQAATTYARICRELGQTGTPVDFGAGKR